MNQQGPPGGQPPPDPGTQQGPYPPPPAGGYPPHQGGYPPPPGGYPPQYQPHRGGLIFAFGLLGLLVCFIFGIMAWAMGGRDLQEMAAGRMDPAGRGLTEAGRIIGIVATIINLLVYCFFGLAMCGAVATSF